MKESNNFELIDHDSLAPPDGALILPKLFCPEWLLVAASASGRSPENDLVLIGGRTEVALSTVVQHLKGRIRFTVDCSTSSSSRNSPTPPHVA